jgi:hypothetical protein
MQKALLGWKEPSRGNSERRADEVSEIDLTGRGIQRLRKSMSFAWSDRK